MNELTGYCRLVVRASSKTNLEMKMNELTDTQKLKLDQLLQLDAELLELIMMLDEALAEVRARYRFTRWLCKFGRHKYQWWHYIGQNCVRCGHDKPHNPQGNAPHERD